MASFGRPVRVFPYCESSSTFIIPPNSYVMEARLTRKRGRGIASNSRNSFAFPLSINDVPHRTDNSICISQRNDMMSKCCWNSSTLHELQRERRPVFLCVFNRIPLIDAQKASRFLSQHPSLRSES